MNTAEKIKKPIVKELEEFKTLFHNALSDKDGLLGDALLHISNRGGKMMRPILVMLIAKNFGKINMVTQNGALGLELLHTASLVHDDVVDESVERRGQASMNAIYDNKVSILVGDYILSTALFHVAKTRHTEIVSLLADLGRTLSDGELKQLSNISKKDISEEEYYRIIQGKTASLFAACAKIGAISVDATKEDIDDAERFGNTIGLIFQIRDDIFDYYESTDIGKPTGNDMAEGKLTLPVIHALLITGNEEMKALAMKVKDNTVSKEEIAQLVEFTKQNGGIEYAEKKMDELKMSAAEFIKKCRNDEIKSALTSYLDYVIQRNK